MPKYLQTALAAYHGDVSDIKETLLSNASPDMYCNIQVGKVDLKVVKNNQTYVSVSDDTLYLNPIQAAIFARKKDNLEFLLANSDENKMWDEVKIKTEYGSKPENTFSIADKLGLHGFTFILLMHAIKFLHPTDYFNSRAYYVRSEIITGIQEGLFSDQQIKEIAQSIQGKQREYLFISLVEKNLLAPIQIFLNNGANVNSKDNSGKCALEAALSLPNVDVEIIRLLFSWGVDSKYQNTQRSKSLIECCRSPTMRELFCELEHANDSGKAGFARHEHQGVKMQNVNLKQRTEDAQIPIAETVPTSTLDCGCCSFRFLWPKRKVATPPENQVRSEPNLNREFTMA